MKPSPLDKDTRKKVIAIHQAFEQCAERLEAVVGGTVIISWNAKPVERGIEDLIQILCSVFEMPWQKIVSKDRDRRLVMARQVFCWFMVKKLSGNTYSATGKLINRDHTTAIHSVNNADDHIETKDSRFYPYYQEVLKRFNEHAENKIGVEYETALN